MWKKILAVVAVLQFVCTQNPKWKHSEPKGTFDASAKLVCTSGSKATITDKNNKVITDNRPKYELTESQVDTTLKITKLNKDDCGEYHCKAGNKSVTLKLGLVVEIEKPKSEYDLANGDKGTVPIVVKGCPTSEIQWDKKGTSGGFRSLIKLDDKGVSTGLEHNSGRMSINPKNGNLIINKVQSSDAGTYRVVHTEAVNELTEETTVNTGDKPIMEKKPKASYDVTESQPLTLPCTFKAGSATSTSWEHTTLGNKKKITATAGRVKLSGTNLVIISAQMNDKGSYTCSGTNKFGTSTATTKINEVIVAPKITSNPVDVNQGKGEKVVLNCTASGLPTPKVEWIKDGKKLGDQKLGKNIYTIDSLSTKDRGEYTCLAHNGAVVAGKNKNDTRKITIIVLSKPTINKDTTAGPLKMVLKEKTTLICKADGFPVPSIVFKKDNKVLKGAKNVASNKQSITKSLQYMPSSQKDFGTIVCTASNKQGNASKEIVIQAINKPSKPRQLEIVSRKMKSVTVKWIKPTDNGGDTITLYTIRIKDINAKTDDIKLKTSKITETVKDLKRGTKYSFEVAAENRAGLGDYSPAVEATTHQLEKPGNITELEQVGEKMSNQISLSWKAPTERGGATYLTYKVIYCINDSDCESTKTNITSITLKNLEQSTKYKITIMAKNTAQEGKLSVEQIFETKGAAPKGKPEQAPRKAGLSGGVIAGIVTAVILIILIVTDLFCCFFNTCGFIYCCYETFCAGKAGGKYEAAKKEEKNTDKENDIETGKETAELKEVKVKSDEKVEEKNNSEKV